MGSEFWNLQNVLLLMGRRLLSGWLLSLHCRHRLSEQRAQLQGQGGHAYLSRLPAADSDLKFLFVIGGGPGRPVGRVSGADSVLWLLFFSIDVVS